MFPGIYAKFTKVQYQINLKKMSKYSAIRAWEVLDGEI